MNKKLILIFIELTFLTIAFFVGTPFEFLNVTDDTIATTITIVLFLLLFFILLKQIRQLKNKVFKRTAFGLFTIIAIPYFYIGIWTTIITWSNYHPMWQDLYIYTNERNEKVISQWRETSGSIYDYRDRKVIKEYSQFRISLDCNAKMLKGIWTENDTRNNSKKIINFDNKRREN